MIKLDNWQELVTQIRKYQYTPLIIALIFGLAALITAWQLISDFRSTRVQPAPPPVTTPVATTDVAALHLMGIYDAKTADIPATQLQLTLQGTVVSVDDPARSHALIQSPGQPTKVYQVGDFVPGNAKIEKIEKDFVILDDNGQLQKLRMPVPVLPNIKLSGN